MIANLNQIHKDAVIPRKAHQGDAAYDVVATSMNITNKYIEYGLGFTSDIQEGYKGVIVPRSSLSKYDLSMCNSPAQIDQGYTGEWKVRFNYIGSKPMILANEKDPKVIDILIDGYDIYKVGDRIAQIYFDEVVDSYVNFTDLKGNTYVSVPTETRGDGGFGSSGT